MGFIDDILSWHVDGCLGYLKDALSNRSVLSLPDIYQILQINHDRFHQDTIKTPSDPSCQEKSTFNRHTLCYSLWNFLYQLVMVFLSILTHHHMTCWDGHDWQNPATARPVYPPTHWDGLWMQRFSPRSTQLAFLDNIESWVISCWDVITFLTNNPLIRLD